MSFTFYWDPLFSRDVDRIRAEVLLSELKRPIIRLSSIPDKFALTYYGADGRITHSLATPVGFWKNGRFKEFLIIGDQEFDSLEKVIEELKSIRPNAYEEEPGTPGTNTEDPGTPGGARRTRRRRYRKRANTRRNRNRSRRSIN